MTDRDDDRVELPSLTRREFDAGARVKIGRNDAKVAPGSVGVVIGLSKETGNVLVDVDGRGRVALTRDALTAIDSGLVLVATNRSEILEEIAVGGDAAHKRRVHSEETKAKMREAARRRAGNETTTMEPDRQTGPGLTGDQQAVARTIVVAQRHGSKSAVLVELCRLLAETELLK